MREGTFKIDRAIREIEGWIEGQDSDDSKVMGWQRALDLLREIRETDPEEANQ